MLIGTPLAAFPVILLDDKNIGNSKIKDLKDKKDYHNENQKKEEK
jgi:hypothetical protein